MTDDPKALELLADAMVMLEEIKRNREMPPFAETQHQYIALGKQIREYLEGNEETLLNV